MKIKDILTENSTSIVARLYKEASKDSDRFYNPENVKYKEKNAEYYEENFKEWFEDGVVPVFETPSEKAQPEYTNSPKKDKLQSPGYRGLQYALAAAGLPYNHNVQAYNPNPTSAIARQTMDGAVANNGQ